MVAKKPAIQHRQGHNTEGIWGDLGKGAAQIAKKVFTSKATKQAVSRAKIAATNTARMAAADEKRIRVIEEQLTERAFQRSKTGRLHGDELMRIGRQARNIAKNNPRSGLGK
jgi:hypothetical protein